MLKTIKTVAVIAVFYGAFSSVAQADVAYDIGNDASSSACAEEVGFPVERIVNRDAHHFLAFLAQHNKPVATELQDWLAAL